MAAGHLDNQPTSPACLHVGQLARSRRLGQIWAHIGRLSANRITFGDYAILPLEILLARSHVQMEDAPIRCKPALPNSGGHLQDGDRECPLNRPSSILRPLNIYLKQIEQGLPCAFPEADTGPLCSIWELASA
jgi:hypothetical protein